VIVRRADLQHRVLTAVLGRDASSADKGGHMSRHEQYLQDARLADPQYAARFLRCESIYMNQREEEEYLLAFGSRKERKAINESLKTREQAHRQSAVE
jgi:hypothetical protein